MTRLSFLHTIPANLSLFEQAARELAIPAANLRHQMRPELREAVDAAGGTTNEIRSAVHDSLLALAKDADAIVVTCAVLGPLVEEMNDLPIPVLRADVAQAHAATAAAAGEKITVLCAAESTLGPVRALFAAHMDNADQLEARHLPQAWTLFRQGESAACLAHIAAEIERACADGAEVVALAHPWMAPAAALASATCRVTDIPRTALLAVQALLSAR